MNNEWMEAYSRVSKLKYEVFRLNQEGYFYSGQEQKSQLNWIRMTIAWDTYIDAHFKEW